MKLLSVLLTISLLILSSTSYAHAEYRCEPVSFSVKLTSTATTTYQLAGQLCADGFVQGKTIQVTVHGGGFDHNYWDFPLDSSTYSYARYMAAAGYSVLNLDRVGVGQSSRPSGADLYGMDLHVDAFALHQVVQAIRGGIIVPGFGPVGFFGERVELVGHSLGSLIAAIEAATYADVDGIIMSSITHVPGPAGQASFGLIQQACLDPLFSFLPCDAGGAPLPMGIGYEIGIPTLPASLGGGDTWSFLFFQGLHDPAVQTQAEALRQTFAAAEFNSVPAALGFPDPSTDVTPGVGVPVLLAVGDSDTFVCQPGYCSSAAALLANESEHFSSSTCLETKIVPDAGHLVNLHASAPQWFGFARDWSDRRVGPAIWKSASQPCE